MEQKFIVLKTDGKYYPMAFITPKDATGEIRAENYRKKMEDGDELVEVSFAE